MPNLKSEHKRSLLNETNLGNHALNEPPSKIELFKNANFSLIEFMKKT